MDGGISRNIRMMWPAPGVGRVTTESTPAAFSYPNNQLAHFECGADDGSCLSDLATRPRVATARYAHLGDRMPGASPYHGFAGGK